MRLLLLSIAMMALPACATAQPTGGCIDVTPGRPDATGSVTVDGRPALVGDTTWVDRHYPDRARWSELQTTATIRCTDGACVVLDQAVADKDCREDACWRRGDQGAAYNVGDLAVFLARRNGLVPAAGTVEITASFRTTGPIKPPKPCPY